MNLNRYDPLPQRPRRRFRWWLLWVPAGIAALAWIIRHIEPAARFDELVDSINVNVPERFRMLVILGIVTVAICLVARVLRKANDEEEEQ